MGEIQYQCKCDCTRLYGYEQYGSIEGRSDPLAGDSGADSGRALRNAGGCSGGGGFSRFECERICQWLYNCGGWGLAGALNVKALSGRAENELNEKARPQGREKIDVQGDILLHAALESMGRHMWRADRLARQLYAEDQRSFASYGEVRNDRCDHR